MHNLNMYLYILTLTPVIILNSHKFQINAQAIGFPSFGGGSPTTPRPDPTPSGGRCSSGNSCIFLGFCPEILELVRNDNFVIRRHHCGFGPIGINVCCPSNGGPRPNTTPTPTTFRTPRPSRTSTTPVSIVLPGFGNTGAPPNPRPPTPRPPPGTGGLLPEPPNCGVQSTEDRIFGGRPAPIGAYPWVAAIGYTVPGSSRVTFECAGAIINSRYVLTAAHCLNPPELGGRQLTLLHLGDWDLTSPTDCQAASGPRPKCFGPHVVAGFEDTIIHPQYNTRGRNSDDIGLIRLDTTLDFNSRNTAPIAPVCLPSQGFNAEEAAKGRHAIAVGWGFTEHGDRSNVLLRVGLPFANSSICANRYGSRFVGSQLCVGGEAGMDTCSGDSGGPLVMSGPQGPPYLIIGIVSFGPLPCALANTPAVYTEVSHFRNWIEQNIRP